VWIPSGVSGSSLAGVIVDEPTLPEATLRKNVPPSTNWRYSEGQKHGPPKDCVGYGTAGKGSVLKNTTEHWNLKNRIPFQLPKSF